MTRPPIVIVTSCNRLSAGHVVHLAGRKYVDAVRLAGALPLVAPPLGQDQLGGLLDIAHGVLLTGSPSNVHPSHFGQALHNPALPLDPERDAWTLPLARLALQRGVPLLGICRGTQEVNVSLGGSLHQAVHEVPGLNDHRENESDELDDQYGLVHAVDVAPGGLLQQITGLPRFMVNSLHGQAVARLAPGLRVEATAPDGLVEAFSLPTAPGFNLCVQWHPEWLAAENPVSMQILQAFGAAARNFQDRVRGPLPRVPVQP